MPTDIPQSESAPEPNLVPTPDTPAPGSLPASAALVAAHRRGGQFPVLAMLAFAPVGLALCALGVAAIVRAQPARAIARTLARVQEIGIQRPPEDWPRPALISEACALATRQLTELDRTRLEPRVRAVLETIPPETLARFASEYAGRQAVWLSAEPAIAPALADAVIDARLARVQYLASTLARAGMASVLTYLPAGLAFLLVAVGAWWWRRSRASLPFVVAVLGCVWAAGLAVMLLALGV